MQIAAPAAAGTGALRRSSSRPTRTASVAAELFNRGYNTIVQLESILGIISLAGLQPSPPAAAEPAPAGSGAF